MRPGLRSASPGSGIQNPAGPMGEAVLLPLPLPHLCPPRDPHHLGTPVVCPSPAQPLAGKSRPLEKTVMLGKTEGQGRGRQRMRWLDGITNLMEINLGKLQEIVRDRVVHGVTKSRTRLSN